MPEQNIAFRLKLLMENIGMSSTQFADKCEIARPTLSQLLSGRNKKISNLIIEQIHSTFPDLSVMWLLFGEGEMWAKSIIAPTKDSETYDKQNSHTNDQKIENVRSSENDSTTMNHTNSENTSSDNKNPYENTGFPTTVKGEDQKRKEIGLNQTSDASVNTISENVNSILNNSEILSQITRIAGKPRMVDHITIYYDDSTFETFYPNRL